MSATDKPASLLTRLANYSYLTRDVAASPPRRVLALFQHGFRVEFMDFEQAVMVGADADVYRRVGTSEARGGLDTQGDTEDALVDLRTGKTHEYALPSGRSVIPLAWSPASNRMAYLSNPEPQEPFMDAATLGDIGILNLVTGLGTSYG